LHNAADEKSREILGKLGNYCPSTKEVNAMIDAGFEVKIMTLAEFYKQKLEEMKGAL
jgi:hypothetical protein